jgi:hypothetical protein
MIKVDNEESPQFYTETITLYNRGEVPGPFILTFKGYTPKGTVIISNNNKLKIMESCYDLVINTQTGQLTGRGTSSFNGKTWLKSDDPNYEPPSNGSYDVSKVIEYSNLPKRTNHGNWSFTGVRAIKYAGSPFLTISPSLDGTSTLEISYDLS